MASNALTNSSCGSTVTEVRHSHALLLVITALLGPACVAVARTSATQIFGH